jgi:hypothetical protein
MIVLSRMHGSHYGARAEERPVENYNLVINLLLVVGLSLVFPQLHVAHRFCRPLLVLETYRGAI